MVASSANNTPVAIFSNVEKDCQEEDGGVELVLLFFFATA